jgi:hypothetical protein
MPRRRDTNPDVDELHRYNYPNWRPLPPPPIGGPVPPPFVPEDAPRSSRKFLAIMLLMFAIAVMIGFLLGWSTP